MLLLRNLKEIHFKKYLVNNSRPSNIDLTPVLFKEVTLVNAGQENMEVRRYSLSPRLTSSESCGDTL